MSYPWQRDRSDAPTQETEISETDQSAPSAAADDRAVLTDPVLGQRDDRPLDGPPYTGDPAVDAALADAAAAQAGDPAEQLAVYIGTHRALQERLADSGA